MKDSIDKEKVGFTFGNIVFLVEDSIKGSIVYYGSVAKLNL